MDPLFLGIVIGVIILLIFYVQLDFAGVFAQSLNYVGYHVPVVGQLVEFLLAHMAAADFIGIAMFGFFSKIFFFPIPSEPFTIYAYQQGANIFLIVSLMAAFGTLAAIFNYVFGSVFSKIILRKEKYARMAEKFSSSKFVGLLIFGTSLLPIPDVAGVVFGVLKVGLKKFVAYTFFGMVAKSIVVLLAFDYLRQFMPAVPFLS